MSYHAVHNRSRNPCLELRSNIGTCIGTPGFPGLSASCLTSAKVGGTMTCMCVSRFTCSVHMDSPNISKNDVAVQQSRRLHFVRHHIGNDVHVVPCVPMLVSIRRIASRPSAYPQPGAASQRDLCHCRQRSGRCHNYRATCCDRRCAVFIAR